MIHYRLSTNPIPVAKDFKGSRFGVDCDEFIIKETPMFQEQRVCGRGLFYLGRASCCVHSLREDLWVFKAYVKEFVLEVIKKKDSVMRGE